MPDSYVRHEGAVGEFDVTAMDDRVIITGRGGGPGPHSFSARSVGSGRHLELALGPVAGTAT